MSIGRILTGGLGSFGGRRYMPTLGYGSFAGASAFDPFVTTRLTILGTSRSRMDAIGTSRQRLATIGTSRERHILEGASR